VKHYPYHIDVSPANWTGWSCISPFLDATNAKHMVAFQIANHISNIDVTQADATCVISVIDSLVYKLQSEQENWWNNKCTVHFSLEKYEKIMENNGKIMSIFVARQKNSVTKNSKK
jgi:hypothetical protein